MIQVCSRCGTRWNVRDRQRLWCPRCQGSLLAPSDTQQIGTQAIGSQPVGSQQTARREHDQSTRRTGPRLPPGYRWIAVRPGAAPSQLRRRHVLGPTPRYAAPPRWGLIDPATVRTQQPEAPVRRGPALKLVRFVLYAATAVFAIAAVVFAARYVLMTVNRSVLLTPVVAGLARWLGIAFAAFSFAAVPVVIVTLAAWLVGRRSAGYAHRGQREPRSASAIWTGCLIPFANLLWAPVFVIETATEEGRYSRMRRLILAWWVMWAVSTAASVYATATAFPDTTQDYADNTLSIAVAYLLAAVAVVLTHRVVMGFERTPVEKLGRRWVIASVLSDEGRLADQARRDDEPRGNDHKKPPAVEPEGQKPAALAV